MTDLLQGTLGAFSAGELLLLFASRQHSGTFEVESDGARARFWFGRGRLLHVLTEGFAPAEAIERVVCWTEGTFTFSDSIALPDGVTATSIDITPLVTEAERTAESRRVLNLFPDEQLLLRVVNRPADAISLTPEEFNTLFLFAGGRTLRQAIEASGRTAAELYPVVHKLKKAGLLEDDPTLRQAIPVASPAPERLEATATKSDKRSRAPIGTLTTSDGRMHPLLQPSVTIGRLSTNEIPLTDGSVSSRHARISRTGSGFILEDLGSRNGTFVNGEKLSEKRLLEDGDLVRLGKVLLTFNLAADVRMSGATQVGLR